MKAFARGVAALPVTLMLSFVALLAVAYSQRGVLFEIQSTRNLARATQAREAAQAGLAWAVARLNRPGPADEDCHLSEAPTATPWAERAAAGALQASCVLEGSGWSCHCPTTAEARRVDTTASPSFGVALVPLAGEPQRWQLSANGHSGQGGPAVQLRQRLGRLPPLDTLPAATLTVRGSVRFNSGPVHVRHTDAGGSGLTVHAGGSITGASLVATSTPGTPSAVSLLGDDASLAALSGQALHASFFRLDEAAWRAQPGVMEIDCTSACDAALREATRHHALVHLRGGLRLSTPTLLGTPERPVLLKVEGPVELHAGAVIHGLVYTHDAQWTDTAGGTVRGAVVAEGDLQIDGPTHIHHDRSVLLALRARAGTFAPLLGSWRDL
jgi:hypothetical protein